MKKIIAIILLFCISFLFTSCNVNNATNNSNKNPNNIPAFIPTQKNHTVKFDTNGGTKIDPKTIATLKSAPQTTKEGYLFNGWYLDEGLTTAVVFPLSIDNDMTIYANWLKLSDTKKCADVSIKMWKGYNSSALWYITPTGFDLDELALKEYHLEITVTYEVYYEKDYDIPFDLGYAGSPKYEAYILDSDNIGTIKENLSTNKETDNRTMTYKISADDLKNHSITLEFSTNNVQNIIHFENIVIKYQFKK